jgi:hypothetical protein
MMARTCAFPLFRFTSVDPGRDGWNLYSYAGSNPIKYVDPDGRIFVSISYETIAEIAGDAAERVFFTMWGTVDVSQLTPHDRKTNEGAALIYDLATSSKTFVYSESNDVQTAAGTRPSGDNGIDNLDPNPDARYNKTASDRPPSGVDGLVVIAPSTRKMAKGTNLEVSRGALAFHELAESFAKVNDGQQYSGAHAAAIQREITLINQRPFFTDAPAGALLINAP